MKFWDSSALVPLVLRETTTGTLRALLSADHEVLTWALSPVEVVGALWRRHRAGAIADRDLEIAESLLDRFLPTWEAVMDIEPVARRARRLLSLHPLRAADSLQLAAALIACEERTDLLPFVTLDEVLAQAARREGFIVLP